MRNFLFFLATKTIFLLTTYAGEKAIINDPLEQRTKSFEKKIDFERALSNHVSSEKIVFGWSTIENPPHLVGWELTGQHHETTGGPLAQENWKWAYKKNEEGVGITIISHKIGEQSALFAIRDFANNSNMLEPPYLKGPTDLGTVSVVVPVPYGYEVHWAYRDLEFSVEATDKSSCLKTAYWLNSVAQAHRKQR